MRRRPQCIIASTITINVARIPNLIEYAMTHKHHHSIMLNIVDIVYTTAAHSHQYLIHHTPTPHQSYNNTPSPQLHAYLFLFGR